MNQPFQQMWNSSGYTQSWLTDTKTESLGQQLGLCKSSSLAPSQVAGTQERSGSQLDVYLAKPAWGFQALQF